VDECKYIREFENINHINPFLNKYIMADKKDLTVINILTEIDNVRIQMHNLYYDIIGAGKEDLDEIIHDKWLECIPSYVLEKFNIPKDKKNINQYAKEQADKMFKEDIIDDMTNDLDNYFDYDAYEGM